ncbi:MAG: CPBP family glutamic-type intramembrane protease [Bifidobacteriaceae bacterium]|nr:CPBP family glutamic-type intramembrane protease [Bifidobacteriaceae bacterium]
MDANPNTTPSAQPAKAVARPETGKNNKLLSHFPSLLPTTDASTIARRAEHGWGWAIGIPLCFVAAYILIELPASVFASALGLSSDAQLAMLVDTLFIICTAYFFLASRPVSAPRKRAVSGKLVLALVILGIVQYYGAELFYISLSNMVNAGDNYQNKMSAEDTIGFYILGVLFAPIAEELLFRGIFYGYVRQLSTILAYIVEIACFAAVHPVITMTPTIVAFAMFQGMLYELTGRLWPCIVMHAVSNSSILFIPLAILNVDFTNPPMWFAAPLFVISVAAILVLYIAAWQAQRPEELAAREEHKKWKALKRANQLPFRVPEPQMQVSDLLRYTMSRKPNRVPATLMGAGIPAMNAMATPSMQPYANPYVNPLAGANGAMGMNGAAGANGTMPYANAEQPYGMQPYPQAYEAQPYPSPYPQAYDPQTYNPQPPSPQPYAMQPPYGNPWSQPYGHQPYPMQPYAQQANAPQSAMQQPYGYTAPYGAGSYGAQPYGTQQPFAAPPSYGAPQQTPQTPAASSYGYPSAGNSPAPMGGYAPTAGYTPTTASASAAPVTPDASMSSATVSSMTASSAPESSEPVAPVAPNPAESNPADATQPNGTPDQPVQETPQENPSQNS